MVSWKFVGINNILKNEEKPLHIGFEG